MSSSQALSQMSRRQALNSSVNTKARPTSTEVVVVAIKPLISFCYGSCGQCFGRRWKAGHPITYRKLVLTSHSGEPRTQCSALNPCIPGRVVVRQFRLKKEFLDGERRPQLRARDALGSLVSSKELCCVLAFNARYVSSFERF